jgi:hypothetical protein
MPGAVRGVGRMSAFLYGMGIVAAWLVLVCVLIIWSSWK